jgi:hypothetical protein
MNMQGGNQFASGMMPPLPPQAQQMLSQVRSPPPVVGGMPVRSPQPGASPRPPGGVAGVQMIHSPRNQPMQSPRHVQQQMGDDMGGQMMLGQQNQMNLQAAGLGMQVAGGVGGPGQDQDGQQNTMTPQDQLSKFVETL